MSISVEGLLWAKKCLHLVVELLAHKRLGRMSGAAGGLKVPEAQGTRGREASGADCLLFRQALGCVCVKWLLSRWKVGVLRGEDWILNYPNERYNLISSIRYMLCIVVYILKRAFREERIPRAKTQGSWASPEGSKWFSLKGV